MNDPVKPNFPPRENHLAYEYLASIGETQERLKNFCVKEGRVTGIATRQAVNLLIDGDAYEGVPVAIHTDIGTRAALLKGEEADPQDYFKDAALMFPFPADVEYYNSGGNYVAGTSLAPLVLVLVYIEPNTGAREPVCVYHILQNINSVFPDDLLPHPTYRLYSKVRITTTGYSTYYDEIFLYDIVNEQIATIPTCSGDGTPGLPFVEARRITHNSTDASVPYSLVDNYIQQSKLIRNTGALPTTWAPYCCGGLSPYGSDDGGYFDGTTYALGYWGTYTPNWTVTLIPPFDYSFTATSVFPGATFYHIRTSATDTESAFSTPSLKGIGSNYLFEGGGDIDPDQELVSATYNYTNGAIYKKNYSINESAVNASSTGSVTMEDTLDYNGTTYTNTFTMSSSRSGSYPNTVSTTHGLRKVRMPLSPSHPNFFHDAWNGGEENMMVRKDVYSESANSHVYSYYPATDTNILVSEPGSLVSGSHGLIRFVADRVAELLNDGTIYFHRGSAYDQLFITIDGFHFVPYDVRESLL